MGFSAAGFFGQLNSDITDQKQYIRARVDEDRTYLREQGLKRQAGIQEQRGAYERAATSLIRRGADERTVLATLEMDPQGLMEVFDRTNNDSNITGNNLNDMMSIASDYSSEASMEEILNAILPTAQEMPNDTDPVTSRRRSIGSWLGLNVDEALSNEVYNQQIVGGMTGDQIMAGMNLPISAQGSNEGGVTYDFTAAAVAAPISAADVNTYIATANDDYNISGEGGLVAGLQDEIASLTTNTDLDEDEKVARAGVLRAEIEELEAADGLTGARRLSAILSIPGMELGANTLDIAGSPYGAQVFSSPGMSVSLQDRLIGAITPSEGTSDDAVNASGVPANPDAAGGANPPLDSTPEPTVDESGRPVVRPRAAGTVDIDENTNALPVTQENADRVIGSYFNANPNSPGLYVKFEGDTLPTLIRGEDYVEDMQSDVGADFYESVIPVIGDRTMGSFNEPRKADISLFEYVLPRRETPVLPTPEPTVNPVADESMAVLEEAVTGVRPQARPEGTPESIQMVGSLAAVIGEVSNPEIGPAILSILQEQDMGVRDQMITSVVGMLLDEPTTPTGVESLLQVLGTLRQDYDFRAGENPLTGIGRAPTQPTQMQPSNMDSGAPASIAAATSATRAPSPVAPANPGTGVNQIVESYYDLLVNQDLSRNNNNTR